MKIELECFITEVRVALRSREQGSCVSCAALKSEGVPGEGAGQLHAAEIR